MEDGLEVRELRSPHGPEWFLVREFYRLWDGRTLAQPGAKELRLADYPFGHGAQRLVDRSRRLQLPHDRREGLGQLRSVLTAQRGC